MLLCDRIANGPLDTAPPDDCVRTAIAMDADMAAKIAQCPVRYVLSEGVFDNSITASVEQPDLIRTGLLSLRAPHTTFWLEWLEPPRTGSAGPRSRAGILVESDATGRAGMFSSAWMDNEGRPFRAPAHFTFDFDRRISPGLDPYAVDRSDPLLYEHYSGLFGHAAFFVQQPWLANIKQRVGDTHIAGCLNHLFAANVRDFPLLCSFLMLLTQPRVLEARESDLAKLNKARIRKGAQPLLEHVELHMRFNGWARDHGESAQGYREHVRRHWVRGHFVKRDERIYWRRNHLRGDTARGMVSTKTLHVER